MAATKADNHGSHVCSIIPPYILEAIMNDESASQSSRDSARMTLECSETMRRHRAALTAGSNAANAVSRAPQSIIPPHILEAIANDETNDPIARSGAESTLEHSVAVRAARQTATSATSTATSSLNRLVYTAGGLSDLPGKLLRGEGQKPSTDASANSVYDHFGETWSFFRDVFNRNSLDGQGLPLVGTVHYNPKPAEGPYSNAHWDGKQMEFGDGDALRIANLSMFLDIAAHEMTHGVVQYTTNLVYEFQSGALNESVADVFASMVAQYSKGEKVTKADWLIGKGFYLPFPEQALRSLKAPGTAHQWPAIDPQPAHFRKWVVLPNTGGKGGGDYGGVHVNSGIPNHAFYLMCMAMGGYSWAIPGKIWYATLTDNRLQTKAGFIDFAMLTVDNAKVYGTDVQAKMLQAWADVGVYVPSSYLEIWSSGSGIGTGVANFNLKSDKDRIFAYDYSHTGKADHLAIYRPGTGTFWIFQNVKGQFLPNYKQGDPGQGIAGFNFLSNDDRAFAFDYESSGKVDYIAIYRPGTGTFWIVQQSGGRFTPVMAEGDPGQGIAGFNLSSRDDKAFAFDFNSNGNLDHIALYRPGRGAFWIAKKVGSTFKAVYQQGDGGDGIGGYDLTSTNDRAFAYDYNSSGKLDHIVLYRPGSGILWIIKHTGAANFEPVYQSQSNGGGIGGYNLLSSHDKAFAYDFDGTGKADHLALYRPGTGTVWILHNYGGTFIPAYRQGAPGAGIGNWDLGDERDRIVPFDYESKKISNYLLMYRPGTGNIRFLRRLNPVLKP